MYCKKCGTKNKDDARFCANCGEKLVIPPQQQAKQQPAQPKQQPSFQRQGDTEQLHQPVCDVHERQPKR